MKRMAIIAIAAALFTSTATVALADDADIDTDAAETRVLNEAEFLKARYLADYSGDSVTDDEIAALRTGDTVIGWGAMFKLLQLAEARDLSLASLLGDIDGDEQGWAFGYRFKKLGGDHPYRSGDDKPKNFGQLKKQERVSQGNQGKKP